MEWFVKAFLKASLAWLALGVTLGVAMAVHPAWTVYRLPHVHVLLLGFVTMMIYGVAYHVIPRFTGAPLYSRRLAGAPRERRCDAGDVVVYAPGELHGMRAERGELLLLATITPRPGAPRGGIR